MPYGTMFATGDFDHQRVVLDYYTNIARLVGPRTVAYWNHTGLWLPETHTLFGSYDGSDYGGPGCAYPRPDGYPTWLMASKYLHLDPGGDSGTGEWSLMALDFFAHTGDAVFLPLAFGAADYFMQHFPINASTGRTVLYPTQVNEGNQCDYSVTSRSFVDCCSDDSPSISGMLTLFEKLLQLPAALTTPEQRAQWAQYSAVRMPALPLSPDGTTIVPARILNSGGNGEGGTLYAMYPHRVFTAGRKVATGRSLDVALATLAAEAGFVQANEGWYYGLNAAALAGAVDVAAPLLLARAASKSAPGYRWPVFAPHYQDFDP